MVNAGIFPGRRTGSWHSHSPPAPTPAMPRATINIQNIIVGEAPLAAADSTMPTTRRVVVATAPVLRPSWSTTTPNSSIPRIIPMRKALLSRS